LFDATPTEEIMSRKLSVKFIGQSFWAISCVILLSAAMTGCGNQARAENERETKSENAAKQGIVAPELVGKWYKKQAGGRFAEYAKYAENLGDFESYEITPDGRVRYDMLTAVKNYDCRVETAAQSQGAITPVSDSELNITLDVGSVQHREDCQPGKNYIKPTGATTADYQWKVGKDEDGAAQLCLTKSNGETACYRRAE